MEIIGWVIWCMLVLFAISLTFGCWKYIKEGRGFQLATGIQALLFWIVVILFLMFGWNKIHIIWIAPLAFFTAQILAIGGKLPKK
jgi:hypothetical protein